MHAQEWFRHHFRILTFFRQEGGIADFFLNRQRSLVSLASGCLFISEACFINVATVVWEILRPSFWPNKSDNSLLDHFLAPGFGPISFIAWITSTFDLRSRWYFSLLLFDKLISKWKRRNQHYLTQSGTFIPNSTLKFLNLYNIVKIKEKFLYLYTFF